MTDDDFRALADQFEDVPQFDELGLAPIGQSRSTRPEGVWRLAEIVMVDGRRFITRVPDQLTYNTLPELPPPGSMAARTQVITPPDMPEEVQKLIRDAITAAENEARGEAADRIMQAIKYDSLQRVCAYIDAQASETHGWVTCFDVNGAKVAICEHNINFVRVLSDREASAYPLAQGVLHR